MNRQDFFQEQVRHIDIKSFKVAHLVDALGQTAFQARNLGRAAHIYDQMLQDSDCTIILCLAGSLFSAGLKGVVCDLIDHNMVDVIVSTSANIVDQDFFEALGFNHYVGDSLADDEVLRKLRIEPFTVVQIDAHGDLRFSYEGSIHNHACVMRRILEMGLPTLSVGIRSICKEEADLIREKQMAVIWDRNISSDADWIQKAISAIQTPKVFISIDLDGIDPSLIPGVGTPQPGGLSWYGLLKFLREVFANYEVLGCDVMELAPLKDSVVSEFTAAKLIYKLIGYYHQSKRIYHFSKRMENLIG